MRSLYPHGPRLRARRGTESPGGGETGGRARASLLACSLLAAGLLAGCLEGGGGTETETVGLLRHTDGRPAVGARVQFRPVDFLADSLLDGRDAPEWSTETDAGGRFSMRGLAPGAYRMHADGHNGRGMVADIYLEREGQRLVREPDTLWPHGSITGRIELDTTADLHLHVQVYGMETRVLADTSDGSFTVNRLPPGSYKLRFLGIGPYRRQAVRDSIRVESEAITRLDSPVVLDEAAKLTLIKDASGALTAIDGLGAGNPVIFDNEFWDNGPENEFAWAKASAGGLDLRGNLVTDAMYKDRVTLDAQLEKVAIERRTASLAGLEGIPDPLAGSRSPLRRSDSRSLEKIPAETSPGSELIVAEARKATADTPLVVVVGGPLTTVANAYLTDPSIASRMIVIAVYPFSINSADTLATYVVAKRCRLVVWGRDYVWKGVPDPALLPSLPGSRMGERLRAFHEAEARMNRFTLGDLAPIAFLFDRRVWTRAELKRFAPPLSVQPASDIAFDFVDIPVDGNDWNAYAREYFGAFANPSAYHPIPLPGRLEAEAYSARSGVRGALTAPGSAPDTARGDAMAGQAGAWLEFKVSATAGTAGVKVRCRSPGGGRLSLAYAGGPLLADIPLAPGDAWTEVEADAASGPAEGTLRATWTEGAFDLDWMEIR